MAQIIRITSEALQATIRRLLPSQQGFGEDLQASNVIQPIIDLTPSAEGSAVRADLQTALAFGNQTAFSVNGTSSVIINTPGFFRISSFFSGTRRTDSVDSTVGFTMSDGLSTKNILLANVPGDTDYQGMAFPFDVTVFVRTGESITATTSASSCFLSGSVRQIADVNGELQNPVGFSPQ